MAHECDYRRYDRLCAALQVASEPPVSRLVATVFGLSSGSAGKTSLPTGPPKLAGATSTAKRPIDGLNIVEEAINEEVCSCATYTV
jgi:hypothetical protein